MSKTIGISNFNYTNYMLIKHFVRRKIILFKIACNVGTKISIHSNVFQHI